MSATADPALTSLRIARAEPVAEGIQLFEVRSDNNAALPGFTPGSHVHVKAPNGLLRRYSLVNAPDDEGNFYQFAVKREANGGGGSRSLVDDAQVGDLLGVSEPRNDFALSAQAPSHVFIAGGIGITPFISMARHLIATSGKSFRLYYLGRSPEVMAFRDELSSAAFRGRVVMHCDQGDPDQAFDLWPVLEKPKGAHVYCCGPRGLMQSVRDMVGHWPSSAVHFEDFGTSKTTTAEDHPFTIRLTRSGQSFTVPADRSILQVLRDASIDVPSSCESGSCGTCIVGLLEGEADHRDLVLTEPEKSRQILVCVSRARTSELVLDL